MLDALLWNLLLTTALAIVLAAVSRLPSMCKRPALRHWLWLLLLAKLVTPPLISLPLLPAVGGYLDTAGLGTLANELVGQRQSALEQGAQRNPVLDDKTSTLIGDGAVRDASGVTAREFRSHTPLAYLHGLLAVSLIGTCVLLAVHGTHAVKLCRWLKRSGTESSLLAESCSDVASGLGIRGIVRSCVVDARTAPLLWGWRRPMVVVPRQLVDDLSRQQLRSIVAHELAHYVRRDHWANTFALVVKVLIWWNPVVWWAHREIRAAQELCCDAIAIDRTHANRHSYATTLLKALDFVQAEPSAFRELALPIGSRRSILRRFEMIGNAQLSYRLSRWTLLILLISVIPLVCFPVRSQGQGTPAATTPSLEETEAEASPEEQPRFEAFSVPVAATSTIVTTLQPRVPNARLTVDPKSKRLIVWGTPAELGIVRKAVERLAQGKVEPFAQGKTEKVPSDAGAATDSIDTRNAKSAEANEKGLLAENRPDRLFLVGIVWQRGPSDAESIPTAWLSDRDGRKKTVLGKGAAFRVGDTLATVENIEKDAVLLKVNEKLRKWRLGTSFAEAQQVQQLRAYRLNELDPETVLKLLQTLMAERPDVRMTIDPKTHNLIVLGSPDDHATVQATLEKIRPQAAATPKPDAIRPQGTEAKPEDERKLRFAFRYQEWDDVLEWFAEQAGLSLVADHSIPGTFNYTDNKEYTVTESMDLLNSVLLTRGYTLLRRDRMLMVVNVANGIPPDLVPRVTMEDLGKHGNFEYVSVIFPLGRRDAEKVRTEIRPLLGAFGNAVILPQTGQMLVTERGGVMRAISAIIQSIPEPEPD